MSASSNYDSLRMTESVRPDVPDFTAKDRQFVDIYDSNNGSYTAGQITFDCQSIVNSNRFIDLKSSYLTVPFQIVLSLSASTFAADAVNAFAASLKNGSYQIINGMTINVANQTVVSLQSMNQIPVTYKILSTWSSEDQENFGPSMNFWKDNMSSGTWDSAAGEINNSIAFTAQTLANPYPSNTGRQSRVLRNWATPTNGSAVLPASSLAATSLNAGNLNSVQKSFVVCGNTTSITFNINAQIPLRYLHDLFDKMPVHRGAYWQMTFHTHLPGQSVIPYQGAATANSTYPAATAGSNTWPNQYCPLMVTLPSSSTTQTGSAITSTTAAFNLTASASITNAQATQCVLHVAMLELENSVSCSYIANPRRTVVYQDFLRTSPSAFINVAPNQSQRANITAGIAKPRGLLIFPHLTNNGVTGSVASALAGSALQSPLTSCGGTTAYGAYLNNFNVQINGANIYEKNIRYRYDHFIREQYGVLSPSGNGVDGMRVGLLDEQDFNTMGGFVYVNLERHPKSNDNVPASIDVEITNGANVTMSYMCFVFYEKEFIIDSYTGALII